MASLYSHLYQCHNDFNNMGGNRRRQILLQVKNEQIQITNDLKTARTNLMGCSLIEEPEKWNALLDIVQNTSIKLGEINSELQRLEHIHVHINRGVLPY